MKDYSFLAAVVGLLGIVTLIVSGLTLIGYGLAHSAFPLVVRLGIAGLFVGFILYCLARFIEEVLR